MEPADDEMSPGRRRVISVVLVVAVAAHFSGLITGDQHWPVLSFPMFSYNMEDGLECPVVFAVPEDSSKPEFRILPKHSGMPLLTIPYAFAKVLRYPHRS